MLREDTHRARTQPGARPAALPRGDHPPSPPPPPAGPRPQGFPALLRVTFFYFLGRTDLYNEDVESAAARLTDALAACRRDAEGHKRVILRYLVPVRGAGAGWAGRQTAGWMVGRRLCFACHALLAAAARGAALDSPTAP